MKGKEEASERMLTEKEASQLSGGKEPPKFDPTTIKTEVHPQSSKFKRSRRPQH